jgi:nicotinate-nucleotide pyrophosphorylase (carboxylating)
MRNDLLMPGVFLSPLAVEEAVRRAMNEDLGRAGDITSAVTIPDGKKAKAKLAARKEGVVSGLTCAAETFRLLDPSVKFSTKLRDGAKVKPGDIAAEIEGDARALLTCERTALNFVTHLSGIATLTAAFVAKVAHTSAQIVCTRKTIPGLRALEKYAVRCGGGHNHRFGLDDAVLIKDNHIAVAGGVAAALKNVRAAVGHLVKVEIEVDSIEQLSEVLKIGGADAVLLDNMDLGKLKTAVQMAKGKAVLEASGGVTLETVAKIAETGVDMISSGALTHSAPALDFGLDIKI